mmetsp:Transcript_35771/g.56998  ORF Transcript_35771/g.56998 Transcript_35771/m.56998 type:complete len:236 (+) Transcript_35771:293-1000(+)
MQLHPLGGRIMIALYFVRTFLWLAIVTHICHQIVFCFWIGWLAIGVNVITQVKTLQRKGDNCWVLLDEEIVVAETFDHNDDVRWNTSQTVSPDFARFAALCDCLEGLLAVKLFQQVEERHLRNEVEIVLEEWLIWQFQGEQECLLFRFDYASLICSGTKFHLHFALKYIKNHRTSIAVPYFLVKIIHEPTIQRYWVLLDVVKLFATCSPNGLIEFMRRNQAFEVSVIIHFPHQFC